MAALAIPLAVLSLATAVKDIVEVAQQIRDAFKQVPENYRKAREMSEDILRFAEDIKLLYERVKDVFEREPCFKKLLEDLLREMNSVHDQCTKLVPPLSVKTFRDRLKIAFYAFRNREKVMNLVSELKTRIDRCYNQFLVASNVLQVASNIRIEASVDRITQNVQSLSTSIVSSTTDTRLVQFMQSCLSPIPHMRRSIPVHELRIEYITMELGLCRQLLETFISKCFQTLSISWEEDSIPQLTWALHRRPFSELEYHDRVVQEIITVRSMLRNAEPADFVNIILQAFVVASALSNYEMLHEAATVMEWITRTWRQITSIFPSNHAKCYLAQCLRENALDLGRIGEFDKACACIDEGMRIANNLILQKGDSPWLFNIMADLLSTHSLLLPQATGQSNNSQELACRAVAFAEQSVVETCSSLLGGKLIDLRTSSGLTDITMVMAAEVNSGKKGDLSDRVYSLVNGLKKLHHNQDGTDHQMLGLQLANLLLRLYPDSQYILNTAAYFLSKMCDDEYVSTNARLEYAKEYVNVYRQLLRLSQSSRYILPLSEALLSYSNTLSSLKMNRESEEVLQEVTSLAKVASRKYFDMSLPSKTEGDYYLHIAEMHNTQGRRQDAIHAAQNSAAQYSGLQFIDNDWDPLGLLKSLAMLCRLYYDSGQYQRALSEGHKAFTIAANSIDRYPKIFAGQSHLGSLHKIMFVLKNLSRGSIPGTVAKTLPSFKQFVILFESELANPTVLRVYAQIVLTLPLLDRYQFDSQREIKHAIGLVDKLIHHPNMLNLKRELTERHINILLQNCRFQEALQHSQDIETMYSNCEGSGISDYAFIEHSLNLFWSQIYTHIPHDAIEVAKETSGGYQQQRQYHLYLLTTALFDAGEVKEGLFGILQAINEGNDKSDIHEDCMWLASQLHFVMRNYYEAGRILDEVVDNRMTFIRGGFSAQTAIITWLAELGEILFAGLMFCCSGDHEKGREALSTFAGYIEDKISVSGPVVIPVICLALIAEQKRGKWKLIQASAKSVLQCDHMELVLNGSWAEIAAPHL